MFFSFLFRGKCFLVVVLFENPFTTKLLSNLNNIQFSDQIYCVSHFIEHPSLSPKHPSPNAQLSSSLLKGRMSQVAPIVKVSRWSFLALGIMYGARKKSKYYRTLSQGI